MKDIARAIINTLVMLAITVTGLSMAGCRGSGEETPECPKCRDCIRYEPRPECVYVHVEGQPGPATVQINTERYGSMNKEVHFYIYNDGRMSVVGNNELPEHWEVVEPTSGSISPSTDLDLGPPEELPNLDTLSGVSLHDAVAISGEGPAVYEPEFDEYWFSSDWDCQQVDEYWKCHREDQP